MRQIVVQKKKSKNKVTEHYYHQPGQTRNFYYGGSGNQKMGLFKSVQDSVRDTGFIYSDKLDNLTISKDILFDKADSK